MRALRAPESHYRRPDGHVRWAAGWDETYSVVRCSLAAWATMVECSVSPPRRQWRPPRPPRDGGPPRARATRNPPRRSCWPACWHTRAASPSRWTSSTASFGRRTRGSRRRRSGASPAALPRSSPCPCAGGSGRSGWRHGPRSAWCERPSPRWSAISWSTNVAAPSGKTRYSNEVPGTDSPARAMTLLVNPGRSQTPFSSTPSPGVTGELHAGATVAATATMPADPDHRSTCRRDTTGRSGLPIGPPPSRTRDARTTFDGTGAARD